MVGVTISSKPYKLGMSDDRIVALVIGNIHSGECAGKEALLMMLRELTEKPGHDWLKQMVLVLVPNYNADANDRMGKFNRPGQIGPENGMGRRENAQNLDLNRDFIKLESPEARSLVQLIDKCNPHLFIDCHTTNGSKHQYSLTYDVPHNPATAIPIRNLLRDKMMPAVTEAMADKGIKTFYYGNFDREHKTWTTFGHEPRYSTEYVGLRGRLAILSEAYSYATYKERIFATKEFVSQCLNYLVENSEAIVSILNSIDKDLVRTAKSQPSRVSVSLSARVEKFDNKFVLKGYKNDEPFDYECDFEGKYVATRSVPLPFAYVLPAHLARSIDRLLMHGITVERLQTPTQCNVTVDTIKELNRNERVFQKHKMLQAIAQNATEKRLLPAGSYIIRTAQPLGRLACYMLECESDDGLVFWNFLDAELKVGDEYPIYRIDQSVELQTQPITEVQKTGRLSLDMIGGKNSILSAKPTPRWTSGDNVEIDIYNRKMLFNARTMSFESVPGAAFDSKKLTALLVESGVNDEIANKIVASDPLESKDRKRLVFESDDLDFVYFVDDNRLQVISEGKENAELINFSPDDSKLAYVNHVGLNVLALNTGETITLSAENDTELLGKLDWVYQEELYGRGNFKGYWFSPDSSTIAFLKLNEADVHKFTISDHIPIRGEDEFLSYPKAGDPNPIVSVGMASTSNDQDISWVDLAAYEGDEVLVSNVSWRPDSSQLIVQIQNREQTYLDLVAVDSKQSTPNVLFRDKTKAWIESPGEPKWLNDGSFLWLSPRDGYEHLYHYHPDGSLKNQLTKGKWEIRQLVEFDADNKLVYLMAAKEKPYNVNGYSLDITTKRLNRITSGDGFHRASFNDDMTMFISSVSSATQPTKHWLCESTGELLHELNASSDDSIEYVGIVEPDYLEIETMNGQPLDAMVIRPPNFDPNKKYPVLIHTYAGPQAPQVRNRFGGSWALWHQLLAQQGYVIWKCDNQSASYRSAKHVWPIHRDLGRNELADIERGVDWLKSQTWVDSERIGIWGWSYGGYMTSYALTHSKSFKIGIAGAPVTDWRNYDTIYTERLMGLPQTNPEGYKSSSVVEAAENLSGKLLLIHGSIDDNVHLGNSMQLALALQKARKQFELMIYPKNRHSVRQKEQAAHLRKLMYDFVIENL